MVAPPDSLLALVAARHVDVVLVHAEARAAREQLGALRAVSTVPVVVALREARTDLGPYLEAGADDCVVAGVPCEEIAARLRAVLRRASPLSLAVVLRYGPIELDLPRHLCRYDGRLVHLPPKEFGLLELLVRRDGRVVSREEALAEVWGVSSPGDPSTVDVHVKRIRGRLEPDPAHPQHLLTVRGLGYRLQA